MIALGIDIGTTTISANLIDCCSGESIFSVSRKSNAFIKHSSSFVKIQSPSVIFSLVSEMLDIIIRQYGLPNSIGVTGQMHGILYYDDKGDACSPLYTWQDSRAEEKDIHGLSALEKIKNLTGYNISSGYGMATHYSNMLLGEVREEACGFATIGDYVTMKLCGLNKPLMHASNAASLGLYDLKKQKTDEIAIKKTGISDIFIPQITTGATITGCWRNIPVSTAIGDNQASFMGSVAEPDKSLCINIGTGSQISFKIKKTIDSDMLEIRPLIDDSFLLVGSALCGGRALAVLEKLVKEIAFRVGANIDSGYGQLDEAASEWFGSDEELVVDTKFFGTRINPAVRGSISNISSDNFTLGNLACSIMKGAVKELYDMYVGSGFSLDSMSAVVASGNGLRKSAVWRKYVEYIFGLPLLIPTHKEEAAYGAALYSQVAAGYFLSIQEATKIIRYSQ